MNFMQTIKINSINCIISVSYQQAIQFIYKRSKSKHFSKLRHMQYSNDDIAIVCWENHMKLETTATPVVLMIMALFSTNKQAINMIKNIIENQTSKEMKLFVWWCDFVNQIWKHHKKIKKVCCFDLFLNDVYRLIHCVEMTSLWWKPLNVITTLIVNTFFK